MKPRLILAGLDPRITACVLTSLALCLIGAISARAAVTRQNPDSMPTPSLSLAVLPDPQIKRPESNHGDYDFGWASPTDTIAEDHTFTVRNDGSKPVTITDLVPSCHCTSAEFAPSPGGVSTNGESAPTLTPGQEIAIHMTVQLYGHAPGSFSKFIFVDIAGSNQPAALLEFTGTLAPSISLDPSTLDFGALKPRQTHTLTLTATYDSRFAPSGTLPPLTCDNPAVHISMPSKLSAVPLGSSQSVGLPKFLRQAYTVTLKADRAGEVMGTIEFAAAKAESAEPPISKEMLESAYSNASVNIAGHILGHAAGKKLRPVE